MRIHQRRIAMFTCLNFIHGVPTHAQTDLHKQTCASPFFGVIWHEQARFWVVCAGILAQTTQNLACSRHITPKNGPAQVCLCRSV